MLKKINTFLKSFILFLLEKSFKINFFFFARIINHSIMNCDCKKHQVDFECNISYRKFKNYYILTECELDTHSHLKNLQICPVKNSKESLPKEWELIAMRMGFYPNRDEFQDFLICALHRAKCGLDFTPKGFCQNIDHTSISNQNWIYKHVSYEMAIKMLEIQLENPSFNIVIVGEALCKICNDYYENCFFKHQNEKGI
jgi:hypothetical protein